LTHFRIFIKLSTCLHRAHLSFGSLPFGEASQKADASQIWKWTPKIGLSFPYNVGLKTAYFRVVYELRRHIRTNKFRKTRYRQTETDFETLQ